MSGEGAKRTRRDVKVVVGDTEEGAEAAAPDGFQVATDPAVVQVADDPAIGLVCLPGRDCSILSTLLAGNDSIEVAYEHPLLRFFTMVEANELRLVHSELVVAAAATRFNDSIWDAAVATPFDDRIWDIPWCSQSAWGVRGSVSRWRECFPAAERLLVATPRAFASMLEVGSLATVREFSCREEFSSLNGMPEALEDLLAALPTSLESLDVHFASAAREIAALLPTFKALRRLGLGSCNLGDAGVRVLAGALPDSLTSLGLRANYFRIAGARDLAAALPRLTQLTSLDLSCNAYFGAGGMSALAAALPASLRRLNLDVSAICNTGAAALAAAFHLAPLLTALHLHGNRIRNEGIAAIAAALRWIPALTELFIGENEFDDSGATSLALALPSTPTLKTLNLSGHSIGSAGACAFATALGSLAALETLELASSIRFNDMAAIGDAGACALAAAFRSFKAPLRTLTLCWNNIGVGGARALAEALPSLAASLEKIDMSNNFIGDEGSCAISVALPRLERLNFLDLSDNNITGVGISSLASALPLSTLKVLDLGGNDNIGDDSRAAVCAVAAKMGCRVSFLSL